ncbi:MAG TPA: WD40 repeat domain-containing protein [Pyrinomonadaceae bacterium]|nr:WD40 repeat domain-containing protein [Pyrinomonadaceae bacterium]
MAGLAFSPDGATLATSGGGRRDRTVDVWQTLTRQLRYVLLPGKGSNTDLAFSPDGRILATWGYGPAIKLWGVETGNLKSVVAESHDFVHVSISADSHTLATANNTDFSVKLWDIETGRLKATLPHPNPKQFEFGVGADVVFNPNGRTLATCSHDTLYFWDAKTLQLLITLVDPSVERSTGPLGLRTLKGFSHGDTIYTLMFSPDGRVLATASRDGTAKLWDGASGKLKATLRHDRKVTRLAFTLDGRTVATGSEDRTARLWDVATGRLITTLDHRGTVWSIDFSPDGKLLATAADNDHSVKIWDVATGKLLDELKDARYPVAFSPDGRTLATASKDATVLLWDMPPR